MKNAKIKHFNISKNVIIKTFFLVLLLVVFAFFLVNHNAINFWYNGFSDIFSSEIQTYFFDVGQANASLIIFPNGQSMIIDTGSKETQDEFARELSFILSKNGVEEIDFLILTHSDEDHIGGTVALLKAFQVNNILRPKIMSVSEREVENTYGYKTVETQIYSQVITQIYQEPNARVEFVEDKVFAFGNQTSLQIFAGEKEVYSQTNSYSPFVYLQHRETSVLFTGDATIERETEFIESLEKQSRELDVDFLQVAHHGSKYNTSQEFLDAIKPNVAIVCAGDEGYPNEEVLKRLENVKIEEVYVTKVVGLVGLGIDEKVVIKIKTTSVDLPFVFVALSCVCLCWLNFISTRTNRWKKL